MATKKALPHLPSIASSGGKARAKKLTPEERKQIALKGASAGGKARAKSMTKAERSESARKAVEARWKKKRAAEVVAKRATKKTSSDSQKQP